MQFGYLISTLVVHVRNRPDDELRLDRMPDGEDLFDEFRSVLRALEKRSQPVVDDKNSRAFDLTRLDVKGRELFVEADTGAYGAKGSTTHVDNGTRRPFGDRDANMTPKRAFIYLPKGAKRGVLIVERAGSSHLTSNLEREVFRPLGAALGVTIKPAAFVDIAAWEKYVDEADGYNVKSVWRPTTAETRATGDLREAGELRMALSGGAAAAAVQRFQSYLREKFRGGQARGVEINFDIPASLTPSNREDFTRRRIEVGLSGPSGKRTIIIEKDQPPAFVYPLGGALTASQLKNTWRAEVDRLSSFYGDSVLPAWQS